MFTLFGIAFFLIGVRAHRARRGRRVRRAHLRAGAPAAALHRRRGAGGGRARGGAPSPAGSPARLHRSSTTRRCCAPSVRGDAGVSGAAGGRLRLSRCRRPLPEGAAVRAGRSAAGRHRQRTIPRRTAGSRASPPPRADYGLPVVMPDDANGGQLAERVAQLQPDFIFSFYYRSLLGAPLLRSARAAARSTCTARCCRSIAVARRSTGRSSTASARPARRCTTWWSGPMPATSSTSWPCRSCEDDDAREVFGKVTVAAETVLARSLPGLIAGDAPRRPQLHRARTVLRPAQRPRMAASTGASRRVRIHDLVRAVAPPFPGAFAEVDGRQWWIHRTRLESRLIAPSDGAATLRRRGRLLRGLQGWRRAAESSRLPTRDGPRRPRAARAASSSAAAPAGAGLPWPLIALKIDVDTYRGTREGVPRLAAALERAGARATFLFSLGPDHTGRAIKRVFRRGFLGKVRRTSVTAALRRQNAALRRAPPGAAHRAPLRARSCGRWRGAGSRWACIPTTTSAGRTAWRGRASRGRGASSCWRVRSSSGVFGRAPAGAWRGGLADECVRAGARAGVGVSLRLGYARQRAVRAGRRRDARSRCRSCRRPCRRSMS